MRAGFISRRWRKVGKTVKWGVVGEKKTRSSFAVKKVLFKITLLVENQKPKIILNFENIKYPCKTYHSV